MRQKAPQKPNKPHLGKCCECKHSYDYHELTNYEPRRPFMCKCRFEQWSQFLDKQCVNGKFEKRL